MMVETTPLDAWLHALLESRSVTGASLALIRNGTTELACAGISDTDTGAPVTIDTVFDAASLTKPLVAYAVLQLVDAGVLDLDEPLSSFAPAIVPGDANAARITTRHLLSHTGGLQNLRGAEPLQLYFKPGAWFSYASVGFTSLQSAVERRTGEPLEATLQRLVFEPLGMRSSSLAWQERFRANVASPHEGGQRMDKHRATAANASYSLQTTAADYAAFVAAVLRADRLRPSTWRQWMTVEKNVPKGAAIHLEPDPPETEPDIGWGLGWGIESRQGTFFQWGKMTGIRAFVMGSTAAQSGVVLLTNSNTGLRLMQVLTDTALPGDHPAIRWLGACVSQ
jgi:CubicO group peptidase (beta-lactamase class C family)